MPAALSPFREPSLDRDGSRLAGTISDGLRADLWIGDTARGTVTRLTHDYPVASPAWSPDGRRVIYSAAVDGPFNLWVTQTDAPSSRRLLTSTAHQFASSVTPSLEAWREISRALPPTVTTLPR